MACTCTRPDPTLIEPGEGIAVGGSGTPTDPYVVSVQQNRLVFQVRDSPTVNFSLIGAGTVEDPYVLSAEASLRLQNLSDVDDPSGPALGDVPVFNGTSWYFAPPPTVPPGAVNTTNGIAGDGSVGAPISIAVSDTVETSLSGLATYIDLAGELRVIPPTAEAVAWSSITGKPTTFAPIIGTTPTTAKAGNWVPTWGEVTGKPSTFAPIIGTTSSTAKAGDWTPAWADVGQGATFSPTQPVGFPDGHVWFKTP